MKEQPDGALSFSGLHAVAKATLLELVELRQENYLLHDRLNQATKNDLAALRLPPSGRISSGMQRSSTWMYGFAPRRAGTSGPEGRPQKATSPWARQASSPHAAKNASFDCRAEMAPTTAAELGRSVFAKSQNNLHNARGGLRRVPSAPTSGTGVDGTHLDGLHWAHGHEHVADSGSVNTTLQKRLQSPLHGDHLWSGPVLLSTTGQLMPGGSALAALL
jgi:hypothetical protein